MQKDTIALCTKLVKDYFALSDRTQEQQEVRNKLYLIIRPYMDKWIESILAQRKVFLPKEELLSLNYECFEFCLKSFKPNLPIPLPNHFYAYANFFLKTNRSIENDNKYICIELDNEKEGEVLHLAYEYIDELREFKKSLPDEYQSVFDDALMSLVDSRPARMRRLDESPLTYQKYCESKRIFKIVIDYLLRR